jgi:hypothetical protein
MSQQSSQSSTKYRPYFSSAELQEIIRCVKTSSTNLSLLRYLESFALKINHGTIDPQLTIKPTVTLEQKLGLAPAISTPQQEDNISSLVHTYNTAPTLLKPAELSRIHQHRYENDLMSPEEESLYEASLMFGETFKPFAE